MMNVNQALNVADKGESEGLRGAYPMAAQVLAYEVRKLRSGICQYCDDTGDVHGIDGEYRGRCSCEYGVR